MAVGLKAKGHGAEVCRISIIGSDRPDNVTWICILCHREGAWLVGWKHWTVVVGVREFEYHSSCGGGSGRVRTGTAGMFFYQDQL